MASSKGAVLAALLGALPLPAVADGLYLHVIPTTAGAEIGGKMVRAAAVDAEVLAATVPGARRAEDAPFVELTTDPYPILSPHDPVAYRAPTFLIDFDEPELEALNATLRDRHGEAPTLDELRRFVDASIPAKVLGRGWDAASRVARSGEGDCTEHAVLLAALARGVGRPARVVAGLLLVDGEGGPQAFGHAWAEIYDEDQWVPVDATPLDDFDDVLARVPLVLLYDEGPGYARALALQMQRTWVRQVEWEGTR